MEIKRQWNAHSSDWCKRTRKCNWEKQYAKLSADSIHKAYKNYATYVSTDVSIQGSKIGTFGVGMKLVSSQKLTVFPKDSVTGIQSQRYLP